MNNPGALADAISKLVRDHDLREQIAKGAQSTFEKAASSELLKNTVQESILSVLSLPR